MTYAEILAELRTFETTHYRSEPELSEALAVSTYDALSALLQKLANDEAARDARIFDINAAMKSARESMDRLAPNSPPPTT